MSHYNKNGNVWSKGGQGGGGGGIPPPMMGQGMMPFQQQQVFGNMGMQQPNMGMGMGGQMNPNAIYQHMGAVAYPNPRGLNPASFQQPMNPGNASGSKERVFTGTVTQIHDNFGFIDDEVFFPRNVCVKGSNPMVGDRVLVEATFNATMPFKWNASRVQVLQPGDGYRDRDPRLQTVENGGSDRYGRRDRAKASQGGRGRDRDRSRDNKDRDDDEIERKRKREERVREREREERKASPVRRRSRSPKRRRARAAPRYMVQIPKISLDLQHTDVFEIKRRYANLYIPSDFFTSHIRWLQSFPAERPLTLNKPCTFHVLHKELDPVFENDAVLDPEDADYSFCAKVMLMSLPSLEELYQKTCPIAEDRDSKRDRDSEDRDFMHPSRLINFLVGLKGKNETMAIGGAWSPSLDGPDPQENPTVLIKTAIRTCKALTGIDLSNCTQWYRFVEIYYRRGESTHKGKSIPARVETTVIFLPDVWSCLPTHPEWETVQQAYRKHLDAIIKASDAADENPAPADENPAPEEKEEDAEEKLTPTHYSKLEPKSLTVADLRNELKARNLPSSGLKAQLIAKLNKALKVEKEKDPDASKEEVKDDDVADMVVVEEEKGDDDKKSEVEPPKKLDEKDKQVLERRYTLPSSPHLIVHPSKTAKSGKFDCTVMSLSLMLDYRQEDAKEHSFEVSLFAEQFNEMLTRDFGFNIFRAIYEAPEKPKEDEKDKKKKEDKEKKEEKDKKNDDKKKKDRKDEEKMEVDAESEKEAKSEESQSKKDEDSNKEDAKKDDRKEKRTDNKKDKEGSTKSDDSEDEETDEKHRKDKRKKEKAKLVTKDKQLLLSFVYFDQTHCGHIFDRDVEELLYILGLQLSRAQIKKLISKVISRDSLHYRKLTDKPEDEDSAEANTDKQVNLKELFAGNKQLLPVFHQDTNAGTSSGSSHNDSCESGLVTYNGAVIDIGKLLAQLERNEAAKIDTETRLETLKSEHTKLSDRYSKSGSAIKHLTSEVRELKDKLRNVEDSLGRANAHSKLFQTTLIDIRDKIDPVLKTVSHKDESRREKEKDVKKERDEVKKESEKDKKDVKKEVKHEAEVKAEKSDDEMQEVKEEQKDN